MIYSSRNRKIEIFFCTKYLKKLATGISACTRLERQRPSDADDHRPPVKVHGHHERRLPHVHVVGHVHQAHGGHQGGQRAGVGGEVAAAAVVVDDDGGVEGGGVAAALLAAAAGGGRVRGGALVAAAAAAVAPGKAAAALAEDAAESEFGNNSFVTRTV